MVSGIREGFHTIDMQDERYIKWQQFKGIAFKILKANLNEDEELCSEDDSSGLDELYKHIEEQTSNIPNVDFKKSKIRWQDFCCEKAVEFTEKSMWESIRQNNNRFWYDKIGENPLSELTHIIHSGDVFWDFLISREHFNKYSRTKTAKKHFQCSTDPYKNLNNPACKESISPYKKLELLSKRIRDQISSLNIPKMAGEIWRNAQKLMSQYRNPIASAIVIAAITSYCGIIPALTLLAVSYLISACIKSAGLTSSTILAINLPCLSSNVLNMKLTSWSLQTSKSIQAMRPSDMQKTLGHTQHPFKQ